MGLQVCADVVRFLSSFSSDDHFKFRSNVMYEICSCLRCKVCSSLRQLMNVYVTAIEGIGLLYSEMVFLVLHSVPMTLGIGGSLCALKNGITFYSCTLRRRYL